MTKIIVLVLNYSEIDVQHQLLKISSFRDGEWRNAAAM